eukprot:evm.model.NODE_18044_length_13276_cov_24.207518.2
MPLSCTAASSPLEALYLAGGLASLYAVLVGLWRWGTYEARTPETYVPLASLAVAPLFPFLPLALLVEKGENGAIFWVVTALLLGWDSFIIHSIWRRFVVGPRFETVDLRGKTAIVTGANTGIGRETSRFLAEMGAKVILACRSRARAEEAIRVILNEAGTKIDSSQLEFWPLDVSSLQSVGDFAATFQEKRGHDGLDILINNAGVMLNEKMVTSEGLEATMATNHYGHFLLTLLLFPELEKVSDGRIVNVSSSLHKAPTSFNFDDPLYESSAYSLFGAYGQSKLANVLFTFELQRRLDALQRDRAKIVGRRGGRGGGGKVMTANAVHPGNVQTEVARNMAWLFYWGQRLCSPLLWCFSKNPSQGAYTSVHAATAPSLRGVGGLYFVNSEATADVSAVAKDPEVAERLWEMSEGVCGLATPTAGTEPVTMVAAPAMAGGGSPTRRRRKSVSAGVNTPGKKATTPKKSHVVANGGGNGGRKSKSPARRRCGIVS